MTDNHPYPALIVAWLTPVYDLFARFFIPETQLKLELINQAHIAPGQRVLDLGAGTGTLAIMIKQSQPEAQISALDGDPDILAIARDKASHAGADVNFDVGNLVALAYPDESFDCLVSSLVFSLLSSDEKQLAAREAYRVLRSGGNLLIADFGPPHTGWGRLVAPLVRRFEPICDNLIGRLPTKLGQAGFESIAEVAQFATLFGTISILRGQKP